MLPVNRHPPANQLRAFARLWLPLFVAAFGAVLSRHHQSTASAIAVWTIGGALVLTVLASMDAARVVFVGLMLLTYPIGWIVSTVALLLLFCLVFTPLGWAMRLAGRDPLRLRTRRDASQWLPTPQDDSPERAFRQY